MAFWKDFIAFVAFHFSYRSMAERCLSLSPREIIHPEKKKDVAGFSSGNEDTRPVFASDVPKDLKIQNAAKHFSYAIYGVEK
jgi:hypothetical protein